MVETMRKLDLDHLTLFRGKHSANEQQMCVMEAVAYLAGEPWSDSPVCASPVIAAFLRSYNDNVSDEIRQTLKTFVPRLVGTRGDADQELRRSQMAIDWLVRVYAPAWMRLANLTELADALAALPELKTASDLAVAQPLLDRARSSIAAARDAAWAAARDAASAAARDAASDALSGTAGAIQATVPALVERMLAVTDLAPA